MTGILELERLALPGQYITDALGEGGRELSGGAGHRVTDLKVVGSVVGLFFGPIRLGEADPRMVYGEDGS
jgi:hypothetical protein